MRPYQTRFPFAFPTRLSSLLRYKSLTHYTKGTRSLRVATKLPLLVRIRFQVLFHSPPGVLFAFPSRYWFTIGQSVVFSLGGWSPHIQTKFLVLRLTQFHLIGPVVYRALTFYGRPSQAVPLKPTRLKGCSPFARHY
jgi:hypothetical protein